MTVIEDLLKSRIAKVIFDSTPDLKSFDDAENKKALKQFAIDCEKDEHNA